MALCTASPSHESIVASASMKVIRPVRFMDEYVPSLKNRAPILNCLQIVSM